MLAGNHVCEGRDVGFIKDGLVVDCGGCGVKDFCVVGGLVVEDFA